MEFIGLLAISCVLMLFKDGVVGVMALWLFIICKSIKRQRDIEKFNRAKKEFKKNHGYEWPGYWR